MFSSLSNNPPIHTGILSGNGRAEQIYPEMNVSSFQPNTQLPLERQQTNLTAENAGDDFTRAQLPTFYLYGPHGSAMQDIFQYKVGLCVAGGIGITPFAAILNMIL